MAKKSNVIYYLLHHDKKENGKMHRGVPSKKFMQSHPKVKGYMCTYIMGCERITEIYTFVDDKFELTSTKISEWKW